ncbi:MAG: hypothetical protein AAFZ18_13575 [Myxococcota bacterium]
MVRGAEAQVALEESKLWRSQQAREATQRQLDAAPLRLPEGCRLLAEREFAVLRRGEWRGLLVSGGALEELARATDLVEQYERTLDSYRNLREEYAKVDTAFGALVATKDEQIKNLEVQVAVGRAREEDYKRLLTLERARFWDGPMPAVIALVAGAAAGVVIGAYVASQ